MCAWRGLCVREPLLGGPRWDALVDHAAHPRSGRCGGGEPWAHPCLPKESGFRPHFLERIGGKT